MKKVLFLLATVVCCMCLVLPAKAETHLTYTQYGECTLITKHHHGWQSYTKYGLAKNGIEILAPEYELLGYDAALHILTFRIYEIPTLRNDAYRIYLFYADTGKCLYSGRHEPDKFKNYIPYVTFEKSGKYTNAVLHYYDARSSKEEPVARKIIGSFFMQDGKLHQVLKKEVKYEALVN